MHTRQAARQKLLKLGHDTWVTPRSKPAVICYLTLSEACPQVPGNLASEKARRCVRSCWGCPAPPVVPADTSVRLRAAPKAFWVDEASPSPASWCPVQGTEVFIRCAQPSSCEVRTPPPPRQGQPDYLRVTLFPSSKVRWGSQAKPISTWQFSPRRYSWGLCHNLHHPYSDLSGWGHPEPSAPLLKGHKSCALHPETQISD